MTSSKGAARGRRARAARTGLALVAALLASCSADDGGRSERLGRAIDPSTTTKVCPPKTVEGVDVSNGNGTIDWKQVKGAGREFAFMKATQGTGYVASSFPANWTGTAANAIYRSPYHFFDPTVDGHEQAKHFLATLVANGVGKLDGPYDLPAMLDLECPDGDSKCLGYAGGTGVAPGADITARALDWLHDVEAATGKKPIVYTFPSYFDGSGADPSSFKDYPLFIATLAPCAAVPNDWTTMAFWQWSWTETVPGIGGGVDADRFNGTLADLKAFVGADQPPAGKLETASCTSLAGWAQDPDTAALPVRVELFVDVAAGGAATPWQSVTASLDHGALGAHGFDVPPPMRALDGKPHVVHAYAVDTSGKGPSPELSSSPQTITCPQPALPAGVRRSVSAPGVLAAWKWTAADVLHADAGKVAALPIGPAFPGAPQFVRSDPAAGGDGELWAIDGTHRRKVAGDAVLASWRIDRSAVLAWAPAKIDTFLPAVDWRAAPFLVEASGASETWLVDDDPTGAPSSVRPARPSGVVGGNEATATDAGATSGCGCALASVPKFSGAAWSLAPLGLLVARRRRRARSTAA